ncbi:putative galacturonosyltransferase-like 7 [Quercus suber]|uniref:Hexosyltransferase n=1 Tax=Quercus suber TaxID=58331 RepID=A0AAW0L8Q0_QUESU
MGFELEPVNINRKQKIRVCDVQPVEERESEEEEEVKSTLWRIVALGLFILRLRPGSSSSSSSSKCSLSSEFALFPLTITLADLKASLAFITSIPAGRFDFKPKKKKWRGSYTVKMLWIMRFSGFFTAAMLVIILSPSLQSNPPAEAIRSTYLEKHLRLHRPDSLNRFSFRRAPAFPNADECGSVHSKISVCDPNLVHVAITLDVEYLRGSIAAVHSILRHSPCPESIFFHFLVSDTSLETLVRSTFPLLKFKVYYFDPEIVRGLISTSVRQALEQPLNYARNYLADLLEPCVGRVIYLDSDLIVVDNIFKLWNTSLGSRTIGAPEYCHANFTKYFTGSSGWTGGYRHIRSPETLLLQHRRDGDRSGQMETGRVHGENREVDGDPEKPPDLRARVIATVPIGFCWTRGAHRAQVEPTRFRR